MKKILFSVITLLAINSIAKAQDTTESDVKFGIKAGINFANYGADAEGTDARTSFHFGGIVEMKLAEKFSIQPELLYTMLGCKVTTNVGGTTIDVTDKLGYIVLPVMAKYYVAPGFSLEAGPQFGYLVSAKGKNETGSMSVEGDIKDAFKKFDMGINAGLGYELPIGLFFQARYTLGLSNILSESVAAPDDAVVTNNNFQLSLGYKF